MFNRIAMTLALVALLGCQYPERGYAEKQAKEYATDLGLEVKAARCTNMDTDGDGYVSCTLSVTDKEGKDRLEAIECAAFANGCSMNEGCRIPNRTILGQ